MFDTVIIYRSGMSGGTATLSFRIGGWFIKHNKRVLYAYKSINDIDNYNLFKREGFLLSNKKDIKKFLKKIIDNVFISDIIKL